MGKGNEMSSDKKKSCRRVSLYPPAKVIEEGFLDVPLHRVTNRGADAEKGVTCNLWYQVSGNPNGLPVLLLHGGPGYYTCAEDIRLWNPALFKVIAFDQRGSGKSLPAAHASPASAYSNITMDDIVDDAEALRLRLMGPAKGLAWVVSGYSWGSAVALAYAARYPDAVAGLLVQGIYTGRVDEHRGLFVPQQGHEEALSLLLRCLKDCFPGGELDRERLSNDPLALHEGVRDWVLSRGLSDDSVQRALAVWSQYENYFTYPDSRDYFIEKMRLAAESPAPYRAAHKDVTGALMQLFLFPDMMRREGTPSMLTGGRIRPTIPVVIVQGEADEICDAETAKTLYKEIRVARAKAPRSAAPARYVSCPASHDLLDGGAMQGAFIAATEAIFDMIM